MVVAEAVFFAEVPVAFALRFAVDAVCSAACLVDSVDFWADFAVCVLVVFALAVVVLAAACASWVAC